MKVVKFNNYNVNEENVKSIVTRVKAFIINDKNEVMLGHSKDCVQLPGGHRENDEELEETLLREIGEEVGIQLDLNDIVGNFFEIRHYVKFEESITECSLHNIVYFLIKTNKKPNIKKVHLTEHEKENNFYVDTIKFDCLENYLNKFIENQEIDYFKGIAKEILLAYEELKNSELLEKNI